MTPYFFSFLTDYFRFFAADRQYDWKSKGQRSLSAYRVQCAISCLSLRAHLTLVTTDFWHTRIVMGFIYVNLMPAPLTVHC